MSTQRQQQTPAYTFHASADLVLDLRVQVAQRDKRINQLEELNRILAKRIDELEAEARA